MSKELNTEEKREYARRQINFVIEEILAGTFPDEIDYVMNLNLIFFIDKHWRHWGFKHPDETKYGF